MLLVTSTDTEAGKTVLTAALAAYGQKYRQPEKWGILKPIQCGSGDREFYSQLFARSLDEINPIASTKTKSCCWRNRCRACHATPKSISTPAWLAAIGGAKRKNYNSGHKRFNS